MNTNSPTLEEITEAIVELPEEAWPELASYIEKLQNQASEKPAKETKKKKKKFKGIDFLHAIAGMGASEEGDTAERDEEILMNEIDPIRGWTLNPSKEQ